MEEDINPFDDKELCEKMTLNSKAKREQAKFSSKSDSLAHKSNAKLLMYLVFSYILSNDYSSLRLLLGEVDMLPTMEITVTDIEDIEHTCINGILKVDKFKTRLKLILRKMFYYYNDMVTIHLVELACLVGSSEIIESLADYIPLMMDRYLIGIVCNKNISAQFAKLVAHKSFTVEHPGCKNNHLKRNQKQKLVGCILRNLSFDHAKVEPTDRLDIEQKISDMIDLSTEYMDSNWMDIVCKRTFEASIIYKNSNLVKIVLRHIPHYTKAYKTHFKCNHTLLDILSTALKYKAYFIFHLIFRYIKDELRQTFNQFSLKRDDHLFILLYILNNGVKIDLRRYYDTSFKKCLEYWLMFCFAEKQDIDLTSQRHGLLSRFINQNIEHKRTLTLKYCDILIELGCNIDVLLRNHNTRPYNSRQILPPIFEAIISRNIDVVTLLLYHGCNCDKRVHTHDFDVPLTATEFGFYVENHDALKVLLLCGAKMTSYLQQEVLQLEEKYTNEPQNGTAENMVWLKEWVNNPVPLRYQCRNAIRKTLGKRLREVLCLVEYPSFLIEFLTFERLV